MDVCGMQPGRERRLCHSSTDGLTEGGGGDLRRAKRQRKLFRCHQGGKVPRRRARSLEATPSPPRAPGVNMAAAEGGGAAPSPGRRGAGPPRRSRCAGAGRSGSRMEELRFGPRLGGRDGPALWTRRQLGSLGVLGVGGGKSSNGGRGK